ncbi:beta-carotene 15,15'-monooxygenase [Olivibacter sp. SDN3]|uniref:beta-carotene 15,15'-monooxygenase n=1 Tax=Olivibacter sp. SDN3 TaxID=2764720 RepID=UPI001651342F|nr:beta-carotene 15,15'-monooxygenase [Olivibacter sp. SDN3]QNL49181.1 beta-carotene 15,15'-monooxygenase [Olivibacter sp. SDN3]
MIQFLKDSTFAVNEVINSAWDVLKRHYFSIAGLCLLLFLTSNTSGILAFYFRDFNPVFSSVMAISFVVIYFGIQLTLFKYIFHVMDDEREHVSLSDTIPSTKELSYFFIAMLGLLLIILVAFALLAVLILPVIYIYNSTERAVDLFAFLSIVFFISFMIRVAFYPFFIIDRHERPFKAIRLSFAITRGNFFKLLLLLTFLTILHLLSIYFNYRSYPMLSAGMSLVNSFLIVPLSSVAIALAYRQMMKEYKGEDDPGFIKNII